MTWTPSHTDEDYTSSAVTAAPTERANVFVPSGTAPASGWPVLLWIEETRLDDTGARQTSIASGQNLAHQCLARGIAFVSATVVPCVETGANSVDGNGAFQPPGSTRWADGTFPSAWKSAVHLVQWAKDDAATYSFDPAKVAIGGERIGADLALWVGLGPDWSGEPGSAQFRSGVSSRPAGVVAFQPTAWFPGVTSTIAEPLFAEAADDDEVALRLNQATASDLEDASILKRGFDDAIHTGIRGLNAAQPAFLWAPDAAGSSDYELSGSEPALSSSITIGDAWGARMLRRQLQGLGSGAFHFHRANTAHLQEVPHHDTGNPTGASVDSSRPSELVWDETDALDRCGDWLQGLFGDRPAIDPAQERMVRNIQALLHQAEAGSGYFNSIHTVERGPHVLAEGKTVLPAVAVTSLGFSTDGPGRQTTNQVDKVFRLEIVGAIKTTQSDAGTQLEYLAHDMEKALYEDRTVGGLATSLVVTNVQYAFPADDQFPLHAVLMDVDVTFRTPSTDLLTHS